MLRIDLKGFLGFFGFFFWAPNRVDRGFMGFIWVYDGVGSVYCAYRIYRACVADLPQNSTTYILCSFLET